MASSGVSLGPAQYDTLFAAGIDQINQAVNSTPATSTVNIYQQADNAMLTGVTESWKYTIEGPRIRLTLRLTKGTLLNGDNAEDLAGTEIDFVVNLVSLPGTTSGTFRAALQVPAGPNAQTPVLAVRAPGKSQTTTAQTAALSAAWISDHAGALSFDFLLLNPVSGADTWLMPASIGFATGQNALVVLGVLPGSPRPSVYPPTLPVSIPQGGQTLYVLSTDVMMRHMIMPALAGAFGVPVARAQYVPSPSVIELTGPISAGSHKVGAITYYPSIEKVVTTYEPGTLVTRIHGTCDLGAGITMTIDVMTRNAFSFDAGSQSVRYLPDPDPPEVHHSDVPVWLSILSLGFANLIVQLITDTLGDCIRRFVSTSLALSDVPNFVQWSSLPKARIAEAAQVNGLTLTGRFQ